MKYSHLKLLLLSTLFLYIPLSFLLFYTLGANYAIGDLSNDNDDIARSISSLLILSGVILIPISYFALKNNWKHWYTVFIVLFCNVLIGAVTIALYSYIIEGFSLDIFTILYILSVFIFIIHFYFVSIFDDSR